MSKAKDHTGIRYGRLVGKKFIEKRNAKHYWDFLCDCGKTKTINLQSVTGGAVKSCGCFALERCMAGIALKHGDARKGKVLKIHKVWRKMIDRCHNPNCAAYKYYGAKGILMCDEWRHNYVAFRDWSYQHGYSEDLTIDRIDNTKGYSPDNCKYSTAKEQARNRTTSRMVTYNGETHCLAEWAEIMNISAPNLRYRISHGWPVEKALGVTNRKAAAR